MDSQSYHCESNQVLNRNFGAAAPQPNIIQSNPAAADTTASYHTGLNIPVDSDEFQAFLKSCLNLACTVVALTGVSYYLKRKVCGKPIRFDAISETDIYKSEPWDLPDLSRLKSRDNEWYFFGVQDKKDVNGSRVNRATGKGYWKATGNDRPIIHSSRTVGMKRPRMTPLEMLSFI